MRTYLPPLPLALFVLTLAVTSPAQTPAEPTELTNLRANWERAAKQNTGPVDKKYQETLEALKLRFTKDGKLNEALAADKELQNLAQGSKSTDAQPANEPRELTAARESWERASRQAAAPIDKIYQDSLNSMKLRFTKDGKLNEALVVDKEIQKLAPKTPSRAATAASLNDSEWTWGSGGTLKLVKGGTATHSAWNARGSWKLVDDKTISLQRPGNDPPMTVIFTNPNLTSGEVTSYTGGKTTMTRTK